MNKTIVIGIGGTGLEVIRSLRRRVVENRGSLENAPNLGFFYIDTDSRDVAVTADNRKRWAGKEYVDIGRKKMRGGFKLTDTFGEEHPSMGVPFFLQKHLYHVTESR